MLLFSDGYYIYHECDNVSNGQKARLLSPVISTPVSEICARFRYYMYGADAANVLRVLLKTPSTEEEIWKKSGIQSPSWLKGSVTVSKPSSQSINVSGNKSHNKFNLSKRKQECQLKHCVRCLYCVLESSYTKTETLLLTNSCYVKNHQFCYAHFICLPCVFYDRSMWLQKIISCCNILFFCVCYWTDSISNWIETPNPSMHMLQMQQWCPTTIFCSISHSHSIKFLIFSVSKHLL